MKDLSYYTYMIRCEDDSIYTGIAMDLSKRMKEHFFRMRNCAKYTLRHKAIKLESAWISANRSLASKLEFRIKRLNKDSKEELIKKKSNFSKLLGDHLDESEFKRITKKKIEEVNNKIFTK